ncbi:MAG: esterase-like activity of phytase family protein [Pseudomonadota bacterium]
MDFSEQHKQANALGTVGVSVVRYEIEADASFHVPYEGDHPAVREQFPNGFFPSIGSGLAFKGARPDGALEFFCVTDRGPNGDGPEVPALTGQGTMGSKIFPAPGFTPSIGTLKVEGGRAWLESLTPILVADGMRSSGLPMPHGSVGSSAEIPLFNTLAFDPDSKAGFHEGGVDTEAIAYDRKRNKIWLADEYGPFLLMVDPATGLVEQRYGPGTGLPPVMALRRANRGMEGMTLDPHSDRIHAFLQSPLSDGKAHSAATGQAEKVERYARFTRWIEFDPNTGTTVAMYAYPIDPTDYAHGRTGNAKLGDLVALGEGKFIVIEQGEGAAESMINKLMLVEIAGATDISSLSSELEKSSMSGGSGNGANWSDIVPIKKTELLDLNALGWVAEKAEGLALVDENTLAMTNDNDFGMKTRVVDAEGEVRHADVTTFVADASGAIVSGAEPGEAVRVGRVDEKERALSLWLLRFERPLMQY